MTGHGGGQAGEKNNDKQEYRWGNASVQGLPSPPCSNIPSPAPELLSSAQQTFSSPSQPELKLPHWFPCVQDQYLRHYLGGNKCIQRSKKFPLEKVLISPMTTFCRFVLVSFGTKHGLDTFLTTVAKEMTSYSLKSLLQRGHFSSCMSAGTVTSPHPEVTAYFCGCLPHIIHNPETAFSLPSFPDHSCLSCLWSYAS